jgi:hypothetical protein
VLHPRLKWRWFDKYWERKPQWRKDAKTAVASLWAEYKDKPVDYQHSVLTSSPLPIRDEWSSDDAYDGVVDQFQAYIDEPFALVLQEQSPIPYWISKLTVWPQLAQMALDIYSTPACSDEPERVFSKGSNLLQQRRRQMLADHVQEILYLQSWQSCGIITLDSTMFEQVVRKADEAAEAAANNTTDSDDEVLYHEQ